MWPAQLRKACQEGDLEIVQNILDNGYFTGEELDAARDGQGRTPLVMACFGSCNRDVVQLLLDRGSDLNATFGTVRASVWRRCGLGLVPSGAVLLLLRRRCCMACSICRANQASSQAEGDGRGAWRGRCGRRRCT